MEECWLTRNPSVGMRRECLGIVSPSRHTDRAATRCSNRVPPNTTQSDAAAPNSQWEEKRVSQP